MTTYEIKSCREYTSIDLGGDALIPLGGSEGLKSDVGLGAYQFEIDVAVTRNGETKEFTVIFQPKDRNNGLEAYSGHEMTFAYGCAEYEPDEILVFCDYDDDGYDILCDLKEIAEAAAKKEFESLASEYYKNEVKDDEVEAGLMSTQSVGQSDSAPKL